MTTTAMAADIREFLNAHPFSGVHVNLTVMAVSGFSINVIDSFTLEEFTLEGKRCEVAVPSRARTPEGRADVIVHVEERFPIHLHLNISEIASATVEPRPDGVNVPQTHKVTFRDRARARLFWVYLGDPPQIPTPTATFHFEPTVR